MARTTGQHRVKPYAQFKSPPCSNLRKETNSSIHLLQLGYLHINIKYELICLTAISLGLYQLLYANMAFEDLSNQHFPSRNARGSVT